MKKSFYLFITILGIASLTVALNNEPKNDGIKSSVVVQLFTSQGCSSCPSADRLLEEVKKDYKNQNVYVLSYHVDYWNRLGWQDPFSQKVFTQTQYAYGSKFGEGRVYTPQAVINGSKHFVGSNKSEMKTSLSYYLAKKSKNSVSVANPVKENNTFTIDYVVKGETQGKNLILALVLENRITEIKRGENGGRTLSNSNIVLDEFKLPLLDHKKSGKFRLNLPEIVKSNDQLSIVAFVQDENLEITGAASLKF